MAKEIEAVFDVVDIKKSADGKYIALIDKFGNEISFKDADGNAIPFNKEAVDRFLRGKEDAKRTDL